MSEGEREATLDSQHDAQLEGLAIGLEQRGEKSAAHLIRLALTRLAARPASNEVRGDPFNRRQVEAVCRAVCGVEGVDPDSDVYGDGCDPQWSRYADAVAAALAAEPGESKGD